MIVGAFGPWVKALATSVSGTDGGNDGWIVVAAAFFGALLLYVGKRSPAAGVWAIAGGAAGAFVAIHDRGHVSNAISNGGALAQALVHVGWGLNLAMVASISLALAGLVWLLAVKTVEAPPGSVKEDGDPTTQGGATTPDATVP